MSDLTNDIRVEWAEAACEAFANITEQDMEIELPDIICDLMANLLHLADSEDMCVESLLARAKMHYDAEITEEDEA